MPADRQVDPLDERRVDLPALCREHASHRANAQAFRQSAYCPHELLRWHPFAMQGCAVRFLEISTAGGALQLPPRPSTRMAVGANIPVTHPATIVAVGIRAVV